MTRMSIGLRSFSPCSAGILWVWGILLSSGVSLIRPYSCNTRILPYPAVSCRILSYPAVSCRILPYPAVSCRILPYPAVSCRICRILPYPAVSCRILPYASNRNPNPNPNLNPNCNPNLEFQLLVKVSKTGGALQVCGRNVIRPCMNQCKLTFLHAI